MLLKAFCVAALTALAPPIMADTSPLGEVYAFQSAAPVPLNADGAVVQVDPASLVCSDLMTFDSFPSNATFDGIIVESGASFAERFAGQSLVYSGDFDVLGSSANNPLGLQVGAAGENLYVLGGYDPNVLTGCGPVGCPTFNAIGEGSIGALFNFPQSEVGFTVVGAGGGGNSMTVNFLAADGTNIDTLTVGPPLVDGVYGFQRAGGMADIAGFSIHNDDGGGIAYDNIVYCDYIEIVIDIKFCSDPNAFNCKKLGVLPVTIFGTAEFDVETIDISTLQLCTADLSLCTNAPRDWSIFDRGAPGDAGVAQCAIDPDTGMELDWTENQDGWPDLDVAFEASEVQEMLEVFCGSDRGAVSDALVVTGLTNVGIPIISIPVYNSGIDQLVKKN